MIEVFFNDIEADVKTWSFPAGDQGISVDRSSYEYGDRITVIATLNNSNDIMQLLLVCNSLNILTDNIPVGHRKLVIPYMPYAQQDRVCNAGEALSIKVMAELINSLNMDEVEVWDPHSQVTVNLIDNCNPLYQKDLLIGAPEGLLSALEDGVFICPDKGAVLRTTQLAGEFDAPIIFGKKLRDLSTGAIEFIGISDKQSRDLSGKTAIIVDDLCLGGGTFIPHALDAKEMGADKVVLFVTHGIFNKGLEIFNGIIDEIYCTDSYTGTSISTAGYIGIFERYEP
tara:strand:- start:963 stop:1814 length:852 start_codon:yes stop_codon:yes gene_type:complete